MPTTLTVPEVLNGVIQAFKVKVPGLRYFGSEYTNAPAKLGQTVRAHIRSLPTVSDYDPAQGGYKNGATEARTLLTDVDLVVDFHKHVPISLTHLNAIADNKDALERALGDAAYVLAKSFFDSIMAKIIPANVTGVTTETIGNTNRDTLGEVRKGMNIRGCGDLRYGIVNTDFSEALYSDPRIASGDYLRQDSTDNPFAIFRNISGFREIAEYPGLPTTGNLSGVFFEPKGVGVWTGVPADSGDIARQYGIPEAASTMVITDPEGTGLSMMAIMWQEQGTLANYMTVTMLGGSTVGKAGGANGTLTDNALQRVRTGA